MIQTSADMLENAKASGMLGTFCHSNEYVEFFKPYIKKVLEELQMRLVLENLAIEQVCRVQGFGRALVEILKLEEFNDSRE